MRNCKIISHRGEHDNVQVLENTLQAFARARESGVWGVECDIRWTADQVPVIHHDPGGSRLFGQEFARSLADLTTGQWQGPVASGYGLHLVFVEERTDVRLPPLTEIRDTVLYELLAERRTQANQAFFEKLRERYDVIVERPPQTGMAETGLR